ncbi:MAG: DUF2608 domain-containing protein [Chlamydiales bacterium]
MKKYIFVLFFFSSYLSAEILESHDIRDLLAFANPETLIITDLNDVLMTTTESLGSDTWAAYEIKKRMASTGMTKVEIMDSFIPLWHHILMEAKFKAVEPSTAGVIRKLQKQGNTVLGLTARYVEMAYPTIDQIHSIGIDFTLNTLKNFDCEIEGGAKYLEGIIFVGLKNDKGETLIRFLNQLNYRPKKILFIDDKEKNLQSVSLACQKEGIQFLGLRYGYLDSFSKTFDCTLADSQLKDFINKKESERLSRMFEADQQALRITDRDKFNVVNDHGI